MAQESCILLVFLLQKPNKTLILWFNSENFMEEIMNIPLINTAEEPQMLLWEEENIKTNKQETSTDISEEDKFTMNIDIHNIGQGLKAIDLFCGIGGFRLGLERLGIKTVFSSDIDKYAQDTYNANFGEVPSGDITVINAEDIPSFDILTAGFPCQPFSYAGRNEGFEDKTRGTLFFDICRIIEHHKPEMFLLENVKGLKSHNNGTTLKIIIETLQNIGYKVKWQVLSSLQFGLPQARERWYCVGFKNPNIDFVFPNTKLEKLPILRNILEENNQDLKLKISDFEIERIQYHFKNATNGERIQHDSSKYQPNTKKGVPFYNQGIL